MELVDGFDFVAAAQILDQARPREHLDRQWYELVIGVRATALDLTGIPWLMLPCPVAVPPGTGKAR